MITKQAVFSWVDLILTGWVITSFLVALTYLMCVLIGYLLGVIYRRFGP